MIGDRDRDDPKGRPYTPEERAEMRSTLALGTNPDMRGRMAHGETPEGYGPGPGEYKCNRSDCDAPVERPRDYCERHSIINPPEHDSPGVREIAEVYCPDAEAETAAVKKAVDDLAGIIESCQTGDDEKQREAFRRLVKLMPESTVDDEEDRIDYMCGSLAARKIAGVTLARTARWRAGFIETFRELVAAGEA